MRSPSVWLTVSSVALAAGLAGCGGAPKRAASPPKLPRVLGQRLAGEADAVARAPDPCAAQAKARELQQDLVSQRRQIPPALRPALAGSVAHLVSSIACVAAPPPPPPAAQQGRGHGHEKHRKHEKRGKHGHAGEGD